MSMKIPSLNGIGPTPGVGRTEIDHPAPEKTPGARSTPEELAAIVAASAEQASEAADKAKSERAGFIEDVRKLVASGSYRVDFDKLADNIIDDEKARTSSRR
ncbi:MAG: flagellar biosynthesis anti-sigma factor FlgM [Deltaproteobacteria bacterium]|nr:flagellar biosynthesis anti-sigma factor FlgM [Deltaproteobacteria bacterium]